MSSGHFNIIGIGKNIVGIGTKFAWQWVWRSLLMLAIIAVPSPLIAAIGCTLANPAEDLKYLFPTMTSYKEELKEFTRIKDGAILYHDLKERLASDLDPIYETFETPYAVYSVFKGDKKIGIVHGVNVPGRGGVIQVFLSTDTMSGEILKFFFQRLESPAAEKLKSKEFRAQFEGLTLADFYKHDYYSIAQSKSAPNKIGKIDKIAKIKQPVMDAMGQADYETSVRGIRKNLILLDFFVYGRKFDPFFKKMQEALMKRSDAKVPRKQVPAKVLTPKELPNEKP